MTVLHWDPLVAILVFKGLRAFPGDVEQGCDVQVGKKLTLGSVIGTTKVEKRQDFYWTTLEEKEQEHVILFQGYLSFDTRETKARQPAWVPAPSLAGGFGRQRCGPVNHCDGKAHTGKRFRFLVHICEVQSQIQPTRVQNVSCFL